MEEKTVSKNSKKIFLFLSLFFVLAILFAVTAWIYFKPYVFVSLDVNPSMEFTVNKFGIVIKAQALNDDGISIIDDMDFDVINKNIEEALENSIDMFIEEGYISGDDKVNVIVSAYSKNAKDADTLIQELKLMIKNKIESEGFVANIEGMTVDQAVFEEAEDLGVTPGKLNLINNIIENDENSATDKVEDWIDRTVNEIVSAAAEVTTNASETQNQNEEQEDWENDDHIEDEEDDSEDYSQHEDEEDEVDD